MHPRRRAIGWILVGIALRESVGYVLDAILGRKQPAYVSAPPKRPTHPEYVLYRGSADRNGGRGGGMIRRQEQCPKCGGATAVFRARHDAERALYVCADGSCGLIFARAHPRPLLPGIVREA